MESSGFDDNVFKDENPKPHLHFHFRPRYKNSVEFMGETFIDKMFGHHYDRTIENEVSEEIFKGIIEEIRKGFKE